MPPCHCNTHSCQGAIRARNTVAIHREDDRKMRSRQALTAYQQVLNQEEEEISAYISSITLAEPNAAEPSLDKLWAPPAQVMTDNCQRKSSTPLDDILHQLDAIESEIDALGVLAISQTEDLPMPTSRSDVFPLLGTQDAIKKLQNRIYGLSIPRTRMLHARQEEISGRLGTVIKTLSIAKITWKQRLNQLPDQEEDASQASLYDTEHHFLAFLDGADPMVQLTMFAMVVFDVVLNVSRRGCRFLLFFAQYLAQLAFTRHTIEISSSNAHFITNFPLDPDTVTSKLPLDGMALVYAVCPNSKCHKTYAPSFSPGCPIANYPRYCSHTEFKDGELCGTELTRKHESGHYRVPIRRFVSFSFKDYVAGLLSRPGFEELMDNPVTSNQGDMQDVFDGEFLRNFKDADGHPFRSALDIGRYSFSLGVDFFNPFTNKQAGKKSSIGVVTVVCLSLPATIRYKTENMFLAGVIPGPNEPPLTAINHYLTPVVGEFLEFWRPGVRLSRTASYSEGRLVLCALVVVVCDLLAARKTAGLAACTHEHFCSVCHCTRKGEGYQSTDYKRWKFRTNEETRASANQYLRASTAAERSATFDKTGVRWSELIRLPYFDITRCVVVDSMHNLFLGLIKEHFTGILGIGLPAYREDAVISLHLDDLPSNISPSDKRGIIKLKNLLSCPISTSFPSREQGITKMTSNVTTTALEFVCQRVGCPVPRLQGQRLTKAHIAGHLFDWRSQQREDRSVGAATSTRHGHVLALEDMEEIWSDLKKLVTPSWMTSVPSNLGTAAHGKLKADQWRALGSVHLPLSLIHIWGKADPSSPRSMRCRQILDVTMSLMSAVVAATSSVTSAAVADAYLQHMLEYLNGIKTLFPDYNLHPNHHMALHIHGFLHLFGPVHSWWTFPFERLIGALERMPHNFKLGQLEETMAYSYTRSSNLRAILFKAGCPEVISNCEPAFSKLVSPQNRDSLQTLIEAFPGTASHDVASRQSVLPTVPTDRSPQPLPRSLLDALRQFNPTTSTGYILSSVTIRGSTYSTASKHLGNSCVIIKLNSTAQQPAQIQQIVQLDDKTLYFGVREYKESGLRFDPYSRYKSSGARLWSASTLDKLELVRMDDIICHFAYLPVTVASGDEVIAVLPLWRR